MHVVDAMEHVELPALAKAEGPTCARLTIADGGTNSSAARWYLCTSFAFPGASSRPSMSTTREMLGPLQGEPG